MSKKDSKPAAPKAKSPAKTDDSRSDLTSIVGTNLRRLRLQRGLSLERLANDSGVSRAMLGQIELGRSAPTINLLWKIARSLNVTFSTLINAESESGASVIRRGDTKLLTSHDGRFKSRALFPFDKPRRVEFYELHLAPKTVENADAHPSGTTENLVVTTGSVEIDIGAEHHRLEVGDSIVFEADVPHVYRNVSRDDATMYLVMSYAQSVG